MDVCQVTEIEVETITLDFQEGFTFSLPHFMNNLA
jgi:hypothetical protein